jgi:hypothetical protein
MLDYKTWILEARKGIFWDFDFKKIEVNRAADFPGLVISNSIAGFVIVTGIITLVFTLLTYPVFWLLIWYYKSYFIAIIVSSLISQIIDGYLTDYSYEKLYCKHRGFAGIMDTVHFFLAILGGLGSAFSRFVVSLAALLIS